MEEDIKEDPKAEADGTQRDQAKEVTKAREELTGSMRQSMPPGMDSMVG